MVVEVVKIDWNMIDPYLISVEFDPEPDDFGDGVWAITASVDIGNELLFPYARSLQNRILRKISRNGSLDGEFYYLVCSPKFKANPNAAYNYDPKYLHTAYTQEHFNRDDATEHLRRLIDGMGEVSIEQFTKNIHQFLETDEWDYLSQADDF